MIPPSSRQKRKLSKKLADTGGKLGFIKGCNMFGKSWALSKLHGVTTLFILV
jgi:hypothetical protein